MFLRVILNVPLSAFAVNVCLCNDYLPLHFVLLPEPPDPAGAKRKDRHYFNDNSHSVYLCFSYAQENIC